MKAMGADPALIEQARAQRPAAEEAFEVWPENWETVLFFLGLQTQWRVGAMGGLIGLRYETVRSEIREAKFEDPADMFKRMKWMEYAALEPERDDGDQ